MQNQSQPINESPRNNLGTFGPNRGSFTILDADSNPTTVTLLEMTCQEQFVEFMERDSSWKSSAEAAVEALINSGEPYPAMRVSTIYEQALEEFLLWILTRSQSVNPHLSFTPDFVRALPTNLKHELPALQAQVNSSNQRLGNAFALAVRAAKRTPKGKESLGAAIQKLLGNAVDVEELFSERAEATTSETA